MEAFGMSLQRRWRDLRWRRLGPIPNASAIGADKGCKASAGKQSARISATHFLQISAVQQ